MSVIYEDDQMNSSFENLEHSSTKCSEVREFDLSTRESHLLTRVSDLPVLDRLSISDALSSGLFLGQVTLVCNPEHPVQNPGHVI